MHIKGDPIEIAILTENRRFPSRLVKFGDLALCEVGATYIRGQYRNGSEFDGESSSITGVISRSARLDFPAYCGLGQVDGRAASVPHIDVVEYRFYDRTFGPDDCRASWHKCTPTPEVKRVDAVKYEVTFRMSGQKIVQHEHLSFVEAFALVKQIIADAKAWAVYYKAYAKIKKWPVG